MTQHMLAEKLLVSRTCITNWESGKRIPDCNTLAMIAKLFYVSVDYLCGASDERYNIRIPSSVNLDLTKLNGEGISMLLNYYEFLAEKAEYQAK